MRTFLGGVLGKVPRPSPAMVVALFALLLAASGAAVAAGSFTASDGTITACRDNKTAALRVINAQGGQACSAKETTITWKDGITGKVADADKLDNKDSSEFLGANQKAADSSHADQADSATSATSATSAEDANTLDGKDSTEFLGANQKAADSDLLDGQDASAFLGADQKATDAEKLDGLDSTQLPHGFYQVEETFTRASPANGFAAGVVLCDEGDKVVGGGYGALDSTSWIATDAPAQDQGRGTQSGWVITWKTLDPNTTDDIRVSALCADFGETHNN
jgi:hypothetical protein